MHANATEVVPDASGRIQGELLITGARRPRVFEEEHFVGPPPRQDGRNDGVGWVTSPEHRRTHRGLGLAVLLTTAPAYPARYGRAVESALAVAELADAARQDERYTPPEGRNRRLGVVFVPEQSPNPESRMRLESERDALGVRRVRIELRSREIDLRSRRDGMRQFALAVARAGAGRVRLKGIDDEVWSTTIRGHTTGTTRMSDDPKKGVTDRHARVHGLENLFIAGGSLFPTQGWAHPTLTIVALTRIYAPNRLRAQAGCVIRRARCPGRASAGSARGAGSGSPGRPPPRSA